MRKLGLIGGIGPESTVSYYRQIIAGVAARAGRDVLPRLSIESLSAFEVFAFAREGRLNELADYIGAAVHSLAAAGADAVALTGNTPNVVLDRLSEYSPVPIVSAVDITVDAAVATQRKRVGLLGTRFTMTNGVFENAFLQRGVDVVTPSSDEIAFIQDHIERELEHGIVIDATRESFIEIITRMRDSAGIDSVILGCTELPLLLNDESSPLPCIDTVNIHVAALVDLILGDQHEEARR